MNGRSRQWNVLAAAVLIALVATFVWYKPDWLGFRLLFTPFVFLIVFGAVWPVLAVGELVLVRRIGPAVFRRATLWFGLVFFTCSSYIIGHTVRSERADQRAGEHRGETRRAADALLSATHDLTVFPDSLSSLDADAVTSFISNNPLTPEQQLAAAKHFPRSLDVLRALADRSDVSPDVLQTIFDELKQLPAASDTAELGGAMLDTIDTAHAAELMDLRSLLMVIGTHPDAPASLLDEMQRSANRFVRDPAAKNPARRGNTRP